MSRLNQDLSQPSKAYLLHQSDSILSFEFNSLLAFGSEMVLLVESVARKEQTTWLGCFLLNVECG
jgi:hypothetical protein